MEYGCKIYFNKHKDLQGNQTKQEMIQEVKKKIAKTFFDQLVKDGTRYTVEEHENGDVIIEGIIEVK